MFFQLARRCLEISFSNTTHPLRNEQQSPGLARAAPAADGKMALVHQHQQHHHQMEVVHQHQQHQQHQLQMDQMELVQHQHQQHQGQIAVTSDGTNAAPNAALAVPEGHQRSYQVTANSINAVLALLKGWGCEG